MRGTARTFLSRMWVRVLAFNVLIVFLPIAGVLSLGTYERQLLRSLERSLVQQGRVLAAALEDSGPRLRENALRVLRHLRQRHDARLRVVNAARRAAGGLREHLGATPPSGDRTGARRLERPAQAPTARARGPAGARAAQETFLYQAGLVPGPVVAQVPSSAAAAGGVRRVLRRARKCSTARRSGRARGRVRGGRPASPRASSP